MDKLGSAVTTVFESSRELVPQSYAGNATHTTEVDPALSRCSMLGRPNVFVIPFTLSDSCVISFALDLHTRLAT